MVAAEATLEPEQAAKIVQAAMLACSKPAGNAAHHGRRPQVDRAHDAGLEQQLAHEDEHRNGDEHEAGVLLPHHLADDVDRAVPAQHLGQAHDAGQPQPHADPDAGASRTSVTASVIRIGAMSGVSRRRLSASRRRAAHAGSSTKPHTMTRPSTTAPTTTGTMAIHSGVMSGESLSVWRIQKLSKRVQVPAISTIANSDADRVGEHFEHQARPRRQQVGDDVDADVAVGAQILGEAEEDDGNQQIGRHLVGPHGRAVEDVARHHVGRGEDHHRHDAHHAHGAQAVGEGGNKPVDALLQGHGQRPARLGAEREPDRGAATSSWRCTRRPSP